MTKIRSSGRLPKPNQVNPENLSGEDFEESEVDYWWSPIAEEARRSEETLPAAGDDYWCDHEPDAYEAAWERVRAWREDLEDDPDWVRARTPAVGATSTTSSTLSVPAPSVERTMTGAGGAVSTSWSTEDSGPAVRATSAFVARL